MRNWGVGELRENLHTKYRSALNPFTHVVSSIWANRLFRPLPTSSKKDIKGFVSGETELPREKTSNTDIWEGPLQCERQLTNQWCWNKPREPRYLLRPELPISFGISPAHVNRQPEHTRYFRKTTDKDKTNFLKRRRSNRRKERQHSE